MSSQAAKERLRGSSLIYDKINKITDRSCRELLKTRMVFRGSLAIPLWELLLYKVDLEKLKFFEVPCCKKGKAFVYCCTLCPCRP